jgi:hypothetical protein
MTDDQVLLADRYRLDGRLGRGGMAEVRRGFDLRLERWVAVKCLKVELAADPSFQERFRREAHAVAGLNHPGIAAIYDTGEQVDERTGVPVPFLVMELVDGPTLRDVIRDQGALPPVRALEVTRVILHALAHSHAAGIIHRDIKPSNIMLTPRGDAKVMDFGIARAAAETTTGLTGTATVIGTAHYLSPEQARGERVDQRSDLYSTACLLYELLIGRPPFTGDSPVSVAYQHVREMPKPPTQVDPALSPEIDRLIAKGMAKDPADRYQSAEEMAADIGGILAGLTGSAGPDATVSAAVLPASPSSGPDPEATSHLPGRTGRTAETVLVGGAVPASGPTPPDADPPTGTAEHLADEPNGRSARRTLLVALLTLLLLAGLGFGAWRLLTPGQARSITVPSVVGATRPDAEQKLLDVNLQAAFRHVRGPDDATRNTVVQQTPTGGAEVVPGTRVTADINVGPPTARVPKNLVGEPLDEVLEELADKGFVNVIAEPVTDPPADAEPDEVVEVQPGEGERVAKEEDILVRYVGRASRAPTADPSVGPGGGGRGATVAPTTTVRSESDDEPRETSEPSSEREPSGDATSRRPSSSSRPSSEPEPEPSEPEPSESKPSEPEPEPSTSQPSEPEPSEPEPSASQPSGPPSGASGGPASEAAGAASDAPGGSGAG